MSASDWDWEGSDCDGLPQESQSEREAAIAAAQRLLAGPTVTVPRTTWLAAIALLRQAVRLLEAVLDEAGTQPADEGPAAE